MGLTGWSWKNDKCLPRASYEWPDHKPQSWTRAALLCLGLGPELSVVSVKLRVDPGEAARDFQESQPWERVLGAWEGSASQEILQACQTRSVGLSLWHLPPRQALLQRRKSFEVKDNGFKSQFGSWMMLRPWAGYLIFNF